MNIIINKIKNMEIDIHKMKIDCGFSSLDQLGECLGISKRTLLRLEKKTAGENITRTFKAIILFFYAIPKNNRKNILKTLKKMR